MNTAASRGPTIERLRPPVAIFIFRRDLRLADNLALLELFRRVSSCSAPINKSAALNHRVLILPVFFFSPKQIHPESNPYFSSRCVSFMMQCLRDLDGAEQLDGKLVRLYGDDSSCLDRLTAMFDVRVVGFNRDYTPFARERDRQLEQWCRDRSIETVSNAQDYTLLPLDRVVRVVSNPGDVGGATQAVPHTVYSQFYRGCMRCVTEIPPPAALDKATIAAVKERCTRVTTEQRVALGCDEADCLVEKYASDRVTSRAEATTPSGGPRDLPQTKPAAPSQRSSSFWASRGCPSGETHDVPDVPQLWDLPGGVTATNPKEALGAWGCPKAERSAATRDDAGKAPHTNNNSTEMLPAATSTSSRLPTLVGGRGPALQRLHQIVPTLRRYKEERDFLGPQQRTSFLSPYLKFGCISMREVFAVAVAAHGLDCHFVKELFWREFFAMILYFHPHVCGGQLQKRNEPLLPQFRTFQWPTWNDAHWRAFRNAATGVPLVDASVRCLLSTGWAHNRSRMVMGNFAVMALHVDWRECERWFATLAVDFDVASNSGGWQWLSGQGTDAASYLRVFNPYLQAKKFDPEAAFILEWIPELRGIDVGVIHDWNRRGTRTLSEQTGYPLPIVDFKTASDALGAMYAAYTGTPVVSSARRDS